MSVIIQEDVSFKTLTTFRIGGPARFLAVVRSMEDLKDAFVFAQEKSLPLFVLGGGSNILASDAGFVGLVIKMEMAGREYSDKDDGTIEAVFSAGENWDECVGDAVSRGFYGLENLSLIPGTVGAVPVQNIGAYGVEAKDSVLWVEAVHRESGKDRRFTNAECDFGYRMSFFKTEAGRKYAITRVAFLLKKSGVINSDYKDVCEYMTANGIKEPTLQNVRDGIVAIRTGKLPNLSECGTAGSFFKNPIISKARYDELLKKYPAMPSYVISDLEVKVPAGWMIDTLCSLKGYREGDAGVYKNQALVLINFGNASSADIDRLAEKIISCVKEKTGITLEMEVIKV